MNLKFWEQKDERRKTLIIPTPAEVDHEFKRHLVEPVLRSATALIVSSGLVWRWQHYTGKSVLVRWSTDDRKFIRFLSIDDFMEFLAQHFKVIDTNRTEWLGPCRGVADRILAMVLTHPDLVLASWELERRRKAAA